MRAAGLLSPTNAPCAPPAPTRFAPPFTYHCSAAAQGYGANFYADESRYEGEWYEGLRSGWGRMSYTDGSVFEGEWLGDQRNGLGLFILENGNRCALVCLFTWDNIFVT